MEATFALGESLVSGTVDADVYRVRDGRVVDRTVASKRAAVHPSPGGGTRSEPVDAT